MGRAGVPGQTSRRLLDGVARNRADDAIVDYAIGLESLLLGGPRDELRYRFSLRGATILSWSGGDKRQTYDEMRDTYDVRSKIVHGAHVDGAELDRIRVVGEDALRRIWWWHIDKGLNPSTAMNEVDERILG